VATVATCAELTGASYIRPGCFGWSFNRVCFGLICST